MTFHLLDPGPEFVRLRRSGRGILLFGALPLLHQRFGHREYRATTHERVEIWECALFFCDCLSCHNVGLR